MPSTAAWIYSSVFSSDYSTELWISLPDFCPAWIKQLIIRTTLRYWFEYVKYYKEVVYINYFFKESNC